MKTAILILSQTGLSMARRICETMPNATIFGPSCVVGSCRRVDSASLQKTFETDDPNLVAWVGPLRLALPEVWNSHDVIIAVMALGIVVRLCGPLVGDKRRDPAVVVVDDSGKFAIAVLGGHAAGANEIVRQVALTLDAMPVITTASDVHQLPAVDQIGKRQGWRIEHAENLTTVAASVVRRETVAVFQDAGDANWWQTFGAWPDHFVRLDRLKITRDLQAKALLVISDRIAPVNFPSDRVLVYRPRTLIAGIGCKRGKSVEAIGNHVLQVFESHKLAIGSLAAIATVTLKADEPGLIAFAASRGVPLIAFPPEDLEFQEGIKTPSEMVRSKIGIPAVAEPAALRASGSEALVVTKQKGVGVTVAVARKPEDRRLQTA